MPSIEEIRQRGLDWMRQQRAGTTSDICSACGRAVNLLDDESVITGGNRKYTDGQGSLPDRCNSQTNCLAKQLLE